MEMDKTQEDYPAMVVYVISTMKCDMGQIQGNCLVCFHPCLLLLYFYRCTHIIREDFTPYRVLAIWDEKGQYVKIE